MFDSIISSSDSMISAGTSLASMGVALVLGILIAVCYMFTQKKRNYNKDFLVAISLLPVIVALVIMLVGNSVARAFSLAGAFALVRFRSAPGNAKDIAVVFFAMASGLACGLGYLFFGAVAAVIICAALVILCRSSFGEKKQADRQLKITIPEDLNYEGVFEDIFKEYTTECTLNNVKTSNMGTLYELTYLVGMKDGVSEKEFIDSLRCRNGNLNISLGMIPDKSAMVL